MPDQTANNRAENNQAGNNQAGNHQASNHFNGVERPVLEVADLHVTFGDFDVFRLWDLEHEPAIVIGMDVLGTVDAIMVDYRRGELRVLPQGASDNIEVRPSRPGRLD